MEIGPFYFVFMCVSCFLGSYCHPIPLFHPQKSEEAVFYSEERYLNPHPPDHQERRRVVAYALKEEMVIKINIRLITSRIKSNV
ncbi:MAG: hypothetical protein QXP36_06995 [Conexivisphaerales archaeon]